MGWELKEALYSLARAYVPGMDIAGNLVVCIGYSNRCPVRSFIDVLVDILDCLNRGTDLDINMRAELTEEIRVIGDDPAVIVDNLLVWGSWFVDCKCLAVIPPPILRILGRLGTNGLYTECVGSRRHKGRGVYDWSVTHVTRL